MASEPYNTSGDLRAEIGKLLGEEKYQVIRTVLEILERYKTHKVASKHRSQEILGEKELSRIQRINHRLYITDPEILELAFDDLVDRDDVTKKVADASPKVTATPRSIDAGLLIMDMPQVDRFCLAALLLEIETDRIPFTAKDIEVRVSQAWKELSEGTDPAEMTDQPTFTNVSKTATDLVNQGQIEYVANLPRASKFRLTEAGHHRATSLASNLAMSF